MNQMSLDASSKKQKNDACRQALVTQYFVKAPLFQPMSENANMCRINTKMFIHHKSKVYKNQLLTWCMV